MPSFNNRSDNTAENRTGDGFYPVFDNAPAGLYRSAVADGEILHCNQRLAEMMGYRTVAECVGHYRAGEHYVDPTRREELLRGLREHGEVDEFEAELTRVDGEVVHVVFNARLFDEKQYLEGVMIDVTAHWQAHEDLRRQQAAVEAKNIALREVLDKVEEQRKRIAASIHENIHRNIAPLIDRIEAKAPADLQPMVRQIARELDDIAAPFTNRLARHFQSLTPMELRICNLIRRGLSSKEVAAAEGIASGTVSVHREHIRRKLRLTNTKVNLSTYLMNMSDSSGEI
ncbi:MAG: PAS domain-containing protein [Planctomycetes bacterium]|jgi:PAS domain S-box-containing protein|nr:PAS and helix-turn-helix domain-containing protein [Phycisphaerae bacterium]NBB96358.1 PAS domain-containing protein [Planctomycetota bacterium]